MSIFPLSTMLNNLLSKYYKQMIESKEVVPFYNSEISSSRTNWTVTEYVTMLIPLQDPVTLSTDVSKNVVLVLGSSRRLATWVPSGTD